MPLWQVSLMKIEQQTQKRRPNRAAFPFPALVTGLQRIWPVVRSTVPIAGSLAGCPLCRGPLLWRLLLPGVCRSLAGRICFQQPVHHWHPSLCNPHAVLNRLYFQQHAASISIVRSTFWKPLVPFLLKTIAVAAPTAFTVTAGTGGNNASPSPPPESAGSPSRTGGKPARSADTRNAPVGRSPALRPHPRSLTQMIPPAGSRAPALA